MRMSDIIYKKRAGKALNREEIDFFIKGYVSEDIPDYQISALLMAICLNGMNEEEISDLTMSMVYSGEVIDLSAIPGIKVDKHSTGGVADTTTLIAAPLVAACGGKVAKMSGRGLGHTGGTLDKLESIPGFCVNQTMEAFIKIVLQCGMSIIGQTTNLVPADKKLYALRDVTATIDSLALIASSVMSKKIASGSDAIVLDVKTGSGAFMQEPGSAGRLAETMVKIGTVNGRETIALVTDMSQPLGEAVGNALEVKEAIEILQGKRNGDLKEVSLTLAVYMLVSSKCAKTVKEARRKLEEALTSGKALEKLACMISLQGGNPDVIHDTTLLPRVSREISVKAERAGYISKIAAAEVGIAAMLLGAGRTKKTDSIDNAVGIWTGKRLGDRVAKGEELGVFHVNDERNLEEAIKTFKDAITIADAEPEKPPLIYRTIRNDCKTYNSPQVL
ncbi:MAG: pyrimidine-nucleoside phosphorylase [Spirochaetota bacterium]